MRVFVGYLEQIVGKSLFGCFIYMFVSIYCILCHFQLSTIYGVERNVVAYCHAYI